MPECGTYHDAQLTSTASQLWLSRLVKSALFLWMFFIVAMVLNALFAHTAMMVGVLDELHTCLTRRAQWSMRHPNYIRFLWLVAYGGNFMVGGVLIGIATVTFHHWRRSMYIIAALIWPMLVGTAFTTLLMIDNPGGHMRVFAMEHIFIMCAMCALGGIVAASLGRPTARLMARIMLPGRLRQSLSFLWTADGKAPPAISK